MGIAMIADEITELRSDRLGGLLGAALNFVGATLTHQDLTKGGS